MCMMDIDCLLKHAREIHIELDQLIIDCRGKLNRPGKFLNKVKCMNRLAHFQNTDATEDVVAIVNYYNETEEIYATRCQFPFDDSNNININLSEIDSIKLFKVNIYHWPTSFYIHLDINYIDKEERRANL